MTTPNPTSPFGFPTLASIGNLSSWIWSLATPERAFYPTLLEVAALESGDTLLDLGCGNGDFLAAAAYAEPGAILVGVDRDADSLEIASRKICGTVHPVELHIAAAESLPLDDESVDLIVASLVLGALKPTSLSIALAECRRVLRPGGRLLSADWTIPGSFLQQAVGVPSTLIRGVLGLGNDRQRLSDRIAIAGFHPPERLDRFFTVAGPITVLEAHRPLNA